MTHAFLPPDATHHQVNLFLKNLSECVLLLKNAPYWRIVSHHDADGLAAAAILCRVALQLGKKFHITFLTHFEPDFFKSLSDEKPELVVLCDMGSGQLDSLKKLPFSKIIVVDHHQIAGEAKNIVHLNAHSIGYDGTFEASASTLTFVIAVELDEKNWRLASFALAGCFGDKQHIGGLKGLNKKILDDAVRKNLLSLKKVLKTDAETLNDLFNQPEPFFKDLSGKAEKIDEFVKSLNMDKTTKLTSLSDEKIKLLSSILVLRLLSQGVSIITIEELTGPRYKSETKPHFFVDELASYLNACGRMNCESTGVALCLEDKNAFEKAKTILTEYRKNILNRLLELELKNTLQKKSIQYFYSDNDALAGVCGGLALTYFLDKKKPVIGVAKVKQKIKISARGTRELVMNGLDLAEACRKSAELADGFGGGHPIAAGAVLPMENELKFLDTIDNIVESQLKNWISKSI